MTTGLRLASVGARDGGQEVGEVLLCIGFELEGVVRVLIGIDEFGNVVEAQVIGSIQTIANNTPSPRRAQ